MLTFSPKSRELMLHSHMNSDGGGFFDAPLFRFLLMVGNLETVPFLVRLGQRYYEFEKLCVLNMFHI